MKTVKHSFLFGWCVVFFILVFILPKLSKEYQQFSKKMKELELIEHRSKEFTLSIDALDKEKNSLIYSLKEDAGLIKEIHLKQNFYEPNIDRQFESNEAEFNILSN